MTVVETVEDSWTVDSNQDFKMNKTIRYLAFIVGGFGVMFLIGFVQSSMTGGSSYDPAGYYNP